MTTDSITIKRIENIKKILLNSERKIKSNPRESIFDQRRNPTTYNKSYTLSTIINELKEYGNKNSSYEDATSIENTFIQSLAKGEIDNTLSDFNNIADALINMNIELIDFLLARNPNVCENIRFKIALKPDEANEILIELAHNTTNVKLLEYLFNTDNNSLKIAVLNNPMLAKSLKCEEYYLSAFSSFNGFEILQISEKNIPASIKDVYKGQKDLQYLKYDITEVRDILGKTIKPNYDCDLFKQACEEQAPARLKYQMLLKSLQKK